MNGFLTKDSNRTGRAGILTNIGQDKDLTVFRIINLAMYRDSLSRELSSRRDKGKGLRLGSRRDSLSRELSSRRDSLSRELSSRRDSLSRELSSRRDSRSRELSSRNALSPEESTKRGREESIKGRAQEAQE
jgi:hypothetical protein